MLLRYRELVVSGRISGQQSGSRESAFRVTKKGVDITHDRAYNIHVDLKRGINSVVECHLAKVKVASSNLVSRSN